MELNYNNYLQLKSAGLKRAEIADKFNLPDWKLKKHIANEGWGVKKPIIANENFFDDYSEESAYWAGFLAADGNVDQKHRVRLMLKYDDIGHLEKFKQAIGSTHAISSNTTTYNRCSFEFTSPHICDILDINFNITPNKTASLVFPRHLPPEVLRHYIRGYFDGDGSICESFSNANSITSSLYATFASGSKEFSLKLYDYLQKTLNLGGHLQAFKDSVKWQIKFNTNDAKSLLNYMYNDCSIYLDRKYELFVNLVVNDNRKKR